MALDPSLILNPTGLATLANSNPVIIDQGIQNLASTNFANQQAQNQLVQQQNDLQNIPLKNQVLQNAVNDSNIDATLKKISSVYPQALGVNSDQSLQGFKQHLVSQGIDPTEIGVPDNYDPQSYGQFVAGKKQQILAAIPPDKLLDYSLKKAQVGSENAKSIAALGTAGLITPQQARQMLGQDGSAIPQSSPIMSSSPNASPQVSPNTISAPASSPLGDGSYPVSQGFGKQAAPAIQTLGTVSDDATPPPLSPSYDNGDGTLNLSKIPVELTDKQKAQAQQEFQADPEHTLKALSMLTGDEAVPTGKAGDDPINNIAEQIARRITPLDQKKFDALKQYNNQTAGMPGAAIRSNNVALDHINTLREAVDAMQNGKTPLFNQLRLDYLKATGSAIPTDPTILKQFVQEEVQKSIAGGAIGASADREKADDNLENAGSQEQISNALGDYEHLISGQIKGQRTSYVADTGRNDFNRMLSPRSAALLSATPTPGTQATAPAPQGAQSAPLATAVGKDGKTYAKYSYGWAPYTGAPK